MILAVLSLAALTVVVVNLTSGSGGGTQAAKLSPAPSVPTAPTTAVDPQAATKSAILDAYRQSYDAVVAVASDPAGSPDDPRLSQHKIGSALLGAQVGIAQLRKAGHVGRGTVEVHPVVIELTADSAVVTDCALDGAYEVDVRTGVVVTPPGPPDVGSASTATFRLINGVWMENTFKDEKRSCALPAA